MSENLKLFLEKVSEDKELAAKVGAEADVDVLIGKRHGDRSDG